MRTTTGRDFGRRVGSLTGTVLAALALTVASVGFAYGRDAMPAFRVEASAHASTVRDTISAQDHTWKLHILAQSDSRAELRPCT